MIKEGFGAMIQSMAKEAKLDVHLGVKVKSIVRTPGKPIQLTLSDSFTHSCDLLVLSGPITTYVRGRDSGAIAPILHPPTSAEIDLFGPKHAMQFLIQLVEFNEMHDDYRALEFWPDHFEGKGQVIVRRDIRAAETNITGGRLGGVQSYSYWPEPFCNKSVHLAQQQSWMDAHNLTAKKIYVQQWYDT